MVSPGAGPMTAMAMCVTDAHRLDKSVKIDSKLNVYGRYYHVASAVPEQRRIGARRCQKRHELRIFSFEQKQGTVKLRATRVFFMNVQYEKNSVTPRKNLGTTSEITDRALKAGLPPGDLTGTSASTHPGRAPVPPGSEVSDWTRTSAPGKPLQATTLGNTTKRLTRKISAAFSSDVEAAVLKASKPKYTAPKEKYVLTLLASLQGCGDALFYLLENTQTGGTPEARGTDALTHTTTGGVPLEPGPESSSNNSNSNTPAPRKTAVAILSTKPQYGLNKVSTFHVQRLPHHRQRNPPTGTWSSDGGERAEDVALAVERMLLCGDIVRKLWRHGQERDWRIVCKVLMVAHRLMRDAAHYADSVAFRLWATYYERLQRPARIHDVDSDDACSHPGATRSQRTASDSPMLNLLERLAAHSSGVSPRGQRDWTRRLITRSSQAGAATASGSSVSSETNAEPLPAVAHHVMSLEAVARAFRDESRTRPEATACSLFVREYARYLWTRLESFRILYLGERQESKILDELGDRFASLPPAAERTPCCVDEMGVVSSRLGEELSERVPFERALREVIPVLLYELNAVTEVRLESVVEVATSPVPHAHVNESMASVNVHNEIMQEAARLIVHDAMQLFATLNQMMESVLEQQLLLGSNHLALMRRSRALYRSFVDATNRLREWLASIHRCLLGFDAASAHDKRHGRRALGNAAADAMLRGELEHAPLDLIARGWWANLSDEKPEEDHDGSGDGDHRRRASDTGNVRTAERSETRRESSHAAAAEGRSRATQQPRERTYSAQAPASSCSSLFLSMGHEPLHTATGSVGVSLNEDSGNAMSKTPSLRDMMKAMETLLRAGAKAQEQSSALCERGPDMTQVIEDELRVLEQTYESCKSALEKLYQKKREEILTRPLQVLRVADARRPSV